MHSPRTFATELIVEPYLHGLRIDTFLSRHFRNYTPWRIQRMIAAGAAAIDAAPVQLSRRVFAGERVAVRLIEPPDKLLDPQPLPVDILYEDPWLIAVNKPIGQVAHPVGEFQSSTLSHALQRHLDQQTPLRGLLRPGVVHRLDRMTSGVLVLTKEHLAHRILSVKFQTGRVRKSYLALVEGHVSGKQGTIDVPIGSVPEDGSILMRCEPDVGGGKHAVTHYEVIRHFASTTALRVIPVTGRIHQIRVHMAHIGHPILGDEFYAAFGAVKVDRNCLPDDRSQRHALHAHQLAFRHPLTNLPMTITAPVPADFWQVLGSHALSGRLDPAATRS